MNYLHISEITLNAAAKSAARYIMNDTPHFCEVEKDANGEDVAATVYIAFFPASGVVIAETEYFPGALAVRVEISAEEALHDFKQRIRDAITAALMEKYGDAPASVIRYGSTIYPMTRRDLERAEKKGFSLYDDTPEGKIRYTAERLLCASEFDTEDEAVEELTKAERGWNDADVYAFCGRGYRVVFWL